MTEGSVWDQACRDIVPGTVSPSDSGHRALRPKEAITHGFTFISPAPSGMFVMAMKLVVSLSMAGADADPI